VTLTRASDGSDTGVGTARAAFFDVDKTLLPGSSMYLFARGLYRHGFYTMRDIAGFAFGQLVFRLTGAEGKRGMEAAREQALAFIEGKRRDDLTQIGHDIVVEVIGPRIYPGMRKVIDAHHADGDKTYLVTAAPKELAQGIAAYLGMDGGLGTEGELVDGVYTGRLVGPVLHGPAKLDAVVRLAGEQGFDLRASSAYSDSVNDRPLLEGVGRPVAVNPDRHLRDLAAGRGWPVQDFRRRRRRGPAVAQGAVVVLALEQAVDEPLGVVPGHVVVDRRLEGRLVHPGLAVLEDVLQVLAQQAPAEEVVLFAVGAGDDHPEEATLL
jgi:HAD superfamily hydrolase (TIGR01490 family)